MENLVLDSTALIELPQLPEGKLFAPPAIFEEAKSLGPQIRSKEIEVRKPSKESMNKVQEMKNKTGDGISEADQQAIALALDMGAVLVSDDYGVQNVASFLGVNFLPLSKPGIKKRRIYKLRCQNCGNWLKSQNCPICGQKGRKAVFREELM
jgi:UPF0271 protein